MTDGTTVTCSNPDFMTRALEWIRGHLTIVIPVVVVVVIALIFVATRYCLRRSRISPQKTAKHILRRHDDSVLSLEIARANRELGSSELRSQIAKVKHQTQRPGMPNGDIQASAFARDL